MSLTDSGDAGATQDVEVSLVGCYALPKAAEQIDRGEDVCWTGTSTATARPTVRLARSRQTWFITMTKCRHPLDLSVPLLALH
jgi:hypothetical protein